MMSKTIVRAWKDPSFRASLSGKQLAAMPSNPAGQRGLSAAMLSKAPDPEGSGTMLTVWTTHGTRCCDPTAVSVC